MVGRIHDDTSCGVHDASLPSGFDFGTVDDGL
jgi:hypothetical protein